MIAALVVAATMTLKLSGDQSQWNAPVYVNADISITRKVDFAVDTGAQSYLMVDAELLYVLYEAGHAHQVASEPMTGIDGAISLMPVYELDELTIGTCHVPGPLRAHASASGVNLIGSRLLGELRASVDVGKGTMTFVCPQVKK